MKRNPPLLFALAATGCEQDAPTSPVQPVAAYVAGKRTSTERTPEEICREAIAGERAGPAAKELWHDCPRNFISPDGRWELFTLHSEGRHGIRIRLRDRRIGPSSSPIEVAEVDFPASISWSPNSDGFFVNDSEGSGQSSYFRYFSIAGRDVVESRRLHTAATDLYKRLFECAAAETYLYVSGEGWAEANGQVHVRIWSSHHSGGCPLDPVAGNELHLVGDPQSGRMFRRHRRPGSEREATSTAG